MITDIVLVWKDSAIRFYTGLPAYDTFIALYNFTKADSGYQLN